ncbi:MAG: hypothetical protein WCI31_16960, partial [Prolixibacteraceae bacterium]
LLRYIKGEITSEAEIVEILDWIESSRVEKTVKMTTYFQSKLTTRCRSKVTTCCRFKMTSGCRSKVTT